jgi:membrane peptidoglycan carboxypeptidase
MQVGSHPGALAAIGQRGVTTTPPELANAYALFATGGEYRAPLANGRRVLGSDTARGLGHPERAVNSDRATGRGTQRPGVRVGGKTGSSDGEETFARFLGVVPADAPRYVICVGLGPRQRELGGSKPAAPASARIARARAPGPIRPVSWPVACPMTQPADAADQNAELPSRSRRRALAAFWPASR